MRKISMIVGAVIGGVLILGLAAYWYVSFEANSQNIESSRAAADREASVEIHSKSSPVTEPGVYKEYDASRIASSSGQVLLFFHAPWCPQCRMIDDDITKNGLPDGVTVLKVDYDSNNDLRKKYGVTLQTTFIKVDQSGAEVGRYVAYNEPSFGSVAKRLLK